MKYKLIALFIILTVASSSFSQQKDTTIVLPPFNKVEASMGINVTLTECQNEKMTIQIANGLPSDVTYVIEGRTLILKMKNRIGKGVVVNVKVCYKELNTIEVSMGATVDNEGTLYADQLQLNATTDSRIELKIDTRSVNANAGMSRITLSGETQYQEVAAKAGGKYLAYNLVSEEAFVKAVSGGITEIFVTNKIDAKAQMGGQVKYKGEPKSTKWEEILGGKIVAE